MVAGVAYYVIARSIESENSVHSAPREQLDRVRERSKEIERDAQRRADEAAKGTE